MCGIGVHGPIPSWRPDQPIPVAAMNAAADTRKKFDTFRRDEQHSRYTLVSIHCWISSLLTHYATSTAQTAALAAEFAAVD
jgi:hypothetical protein